MEIPIFPQRLAICNERRSPYLHPHSTGKKEARTCSIQSHLSHVHHQTKREPPEVNPSRSIRVKCTTDSSGNEPVIQRLTPKPKAEIFPSTQNSSCDTKGTPLLRKCQEQEQKTKVRISTASNDVPTSKTERAEAAWPWRKETPAVVGLCSGFVCWFRSSGKVKQVVLQPVV